MALMGQFWLSRWLAPGSNGIGRGWVVSIIVRAYAGEFEKTSYTEIKSSCARHGVRIRISTIPTFDYYFFAAFSCSYI